MRLKRYIPMQIIGMLRQSEVKVFMGRRVGQVYRDLGMREQTSYR